jgi:hypothetical protein
VAARSSPHGAITIHPGLDAVKSSRAPARRSVPPPSRDRAANPPGFRPAAQIRARAPARRPRASAARPSTVATVGPRP